MGFGWCANTRYTPLMRIWLVLLLACPAPEPVEAPVDESAGSELSERALDESWMREALEVGLDRYAADEIRWVEHFSETAEGEEADPRTDAEGMVREAIRLCGEDRLERLRVLTRALRDKLGVLGPDAFSCEGRSCTFPPVMEYDLDATIDLRRAGESFEVVAVTRIDSATATQEYLDEAREWVDLALRELDPCLPET